ncbi:MAG: hypothetical protein LBQ60_21700 [Bacteroidales bacterium]|jgi:predicted aldo/keto reductase-like oxidoreductase|nr:hypothetical protein [Bacteroidales bacterium]
MENNEIKITSNVLNDIKKRFREKVHIPDKMPEKGSEAIVKISENLKDFDEDTFDIHMIHTIDQILVEMNLNPGQEERTGIWEYLKKDIKRAENREIIK